MAAQRPLFGNEPAAPIALAPLQDRLARLLQTLSEGTLALAPGDTAWTDGVRVYLPAHLPANIDPGDGLARYKAQLALLWAQNRFGSYDFDYAMEMLPWSHSAPQTACALAWLAWFEAIRLEACIARELPGLAAELQAAHRPFAYEFAPMVCDLQTPRASVHDSLRWVRQSLKVGADGTASGVPGPLPPYSPHNVRLDPLAAMRQRSARPNPIDDEWDYRRRDGRRDGCRLHEIDSPLGDPAWVAQTRQHYRATLRTLRRRFATLRSEETLHNRRPDGEEIDIDAQVAAYADRRAQAEISPQLYRQRLRRERSLATMLMVDMSASTQGRGNDAQREALLLWCEALDACDDSYAIYGYSGSTRNCCEIYRIKHFDEKYDDTIRRRIAGIAPQEYSRMDAAVRHLTHLLLERNVRHRLLLTLLAARPNNRDSDEGEGDRNRYGIEDTRRALLAAHEKGIRSHAVALSLARHDADYLPQLYGLAHYSIVDDARALPLKLSEIYRRLTR